MIDEPLAPVPAHETVDEFAADLRHLRIEAGNPTLAALSAATTVSKTVLSEAFGGRRLPTSRTVAALARFFDVDTRALVRRRDAIEAASLSAEKVDPGPPAVADPPAAAPLPQRTSHPRMWFAVAAAFVVGAVLSGVVTAGVVSARDATAQAEAVASASAAPRILVKTGQNPADTRCVDDAVVAASATRARGTQLQIIWSAACDAAWARITRYDDKAAGNEVTTAIYRKIAPHGSDRQSTTEPDAQSAFTTLMVRPTPDTELCAVGSLTVSGQTIGLGDPICL